MALGAPSFIQWGSQLQHVLSFEDPQILDGPRSWRRWAPGSESSRNSAGIADAWITGFDYLLAGRARWFDSASWDELQRFLDWASDGNAFRFYPVADVPDWYIDACYLESPAGNPEPGLENTDGSQSVDLVIRTQTMDFGLALRGLALEITPNYPWSAATFTRTAEAWENTGPGPRGLRQVTTNVPRVGHWVQDPVSGLVVRTFLVESIAVTQRAVRTQDLSFWTDVNGTALRAQTYVRGALVLDLVGDVSATLRPHRYIVADMSGGSNGTYMVAWHTAMAAGAANVVHQVDLLDNTASQYRMAAQYSFNADGVISAITLAGPGGPNEAHVATVDLGGGLYRVIMRVQNITAANEHRLRIWPTAESENVSQIGEFYVGGFDFFEINGNVPVQYMRNDGAVKVTRNADNPGVPMPIGIMPLALYARFYPLQNFQGAGTFARFLDIGANFPNSGAFLVVNDSGHIQADFFSQNSYSGSSLPGVGWNYGERVEALITIDHFGRIQCTVRKNAGALNVGGLGGKIGFGTRVWSGTGKLHLGSANTSSATSSVAYEVVKLMPLSINTGVPTMDKMANA